jgi:hypothetical protein
MITFIERIFKAYPQLKGAVLSIVVALVAKFGFHVTETQLLAVVSAAIAFFHSMAALGANAAKREAVSHVRATK